MNIKSSYNLDTVNVSNYVTFYSPFSSQTEGSSGRRQDFVSLGLRDGYLEFR